MTDLPSNNPYLDALRDDLPTPTDEARIRRRLAAAGLAVTVTSIGQGAAAAGIGAKSTSLLASLSQGFGTLPMLGQVGLVAAATALVASGPVVLITKATLPEHRTMAAESYVPRAATKAAISPSPQLQPLTQEPKSMTAEPELREEPALAPALGQRLQPSGARAPSAAADATGSSLPEETRLIDSALMAIRAGKLEEAARLLEAHADQFPVGKLVRERERASLKLREATQTDRY